MPDSPALAPAKKRIDYVDTIRGVCILLVNYFHSGISLFIIKYVADICVHPFLFLAGYFFSRRLSLADNARKKARSMIVPYYIFGLFYYCIWLAAFGGSGRDIIYPLIAVLYMPTGFFPIESALYFLPMMFFAVMIFALIERYIKPEVLRAVLVLVITAIGNIWVHICDVRLPMSIDVSMSLLIYIYLGYHGKAILKFTDSLLVKIRSNILKIAVFIALTVLNYLAISLSPLSNIRNGEWGLIPITHLNTCVTMLLWVYFFRWFDTVKLFSGVNRALKYIGKNSMVFMCFSHVGLKIGQFIAFRLPLPEIGCKLLMYVLSILVIVPVVAIFNRTKLHLIFGK